jgi:hypothetical protein
MAVGDAIMKEEIDKNKKVFIVADEVRADSPDHLSSFKQWLEGFANELRNINGEIIEKKGGGVAVIALTSDALLTSSPAFRSSLIVISFRRFIGSPHLFGFTSVIWGQSGWPEIPQEPIIPGSKD